MEGGSGYANTSNGGHQWLRHRSERRKTDNLKTESRRGITVVIIDRH